MKESEPKVPFRNYLVCYDGNRQIDWRTEEEFRVLSERFKVDWYAIKTDKGMEYFRESADNNEQEISTG